MSADDVPLSTVPGDPLGQRFTLGPHTGFDALEQSVLECAPGLSRARETGDAEEVLFVLAGRGRVHLGDEAFELEPETGVHLGPGKAYALECDGPSPLALVSVTIPEPEWIADAARAPVRRLADQEAQDATAGREFRIVADPSTGLHSATHFAGYIPTTRAPDHFHLYDEVIFVLEGHGVFRAGGEAHPLGPGSCIQLPARTVHCLENTGANVMRVVGVFRPAGSPAAAYYPDGTPAYVETPTD